MDWQAITSDLYQKIKPVSAYLKSYKSDSSLKGFSGLWIAFEMNEFMYEDPFYGYQSSKAVFNMEIELLDFQRVGNINQIHELANMKEDNTSNLVMGAFSNSLHIVVSQIKFGTINNDCIPLEMEYSITNSDSYGMMDGSLKDHIQMSGKIKIDLKIEELILVIQNSSSLENVLSRLNSDIYDIEKTMEAIGKNANHHDRKRYKVPYKSIVPK